MSLLLLRYSFHSKTSNTKTLLVHIPKGTGLLGIARILKEHHLIDHVLPFALNVIIKCDARHLKAGEYAIEPSMTPFDIYAMMRSGLTYKRRLTVVEGLKSSEIVAMIQTTEGLRGVIDQMPAEGSLLPETYFYEYEDDRATLVRRMQHGMSASIQKMWKQRTSDLPLKQASEAVVLASIVEKETALPDERARVAAVFLNRLSIGMPLQADPTVVYGLEKQGGKPLDRELTHEDLKKDTPYNTYLITGLPPTPICNPGEASLRAVLNPLKTKELYFVAEGTGRHIFSETYEQHAIHHQALRKLRALKKQSSK